MDSISYASPGHIGLKVDVAVAKDVERVMKAVSGDDDFEGLRTVFRECHSFLVDNGLATLSSSEFNKGYALYEELTASLRQFAVELLERTGHGADIKKMVSDDFALPLVKTLLAYVRRIMRLRRYLDDGLITKFGGKPIEKT
ncbi:hypothetical protein SAMN05443245_0468 [Paraburkholderia fungorum]|uniref:Uncharacterized protein n=1 Tax=Paraburkholderia fungorum TaxID=134537 RepID=A0A1H0Z5Z9_9BURK|nr:hypothetical protein [Paraburkholderia fungorum]SDQ22798.1 hypothetical protein SAMN05443245_0468 [Paraburkholderia fungorum]